MKIHHVLSPLLAVLMVSGLTACGQTGPLFRPNDKASLEKYDPRNDYRINQEEQAKTANAESAAPQSGSEAKTTPLAQDDTSAPVAAAPVQEKPAPKTPIAPQPRTEEAPVAPKAVTPKAAVAPSQPAVKTPAASATEAAIPTTTPVSSIPAPAANATSPWSGIQWTPYRAEGAAQ